MTIHNYKFGQFPTRKIKLLGRIWRRLEIGEVIETHDIIYNDVADDDNYRSAIFYSRQKYNPNKEHKNLRIWRKITE